MKLSKIATVFTICAILLISSFLCVAFAYMFRQTETLKTELVPANVACQVQETFADDIKSSITVTNTGNIDAYLRVRLVSYWVNEADEIMPVASQMPAFTYHSDWIEIGENTYCYKAPVAPNEATPANLLATPITLGTSAEGYRQVVAVFAEAIQAEPIDAVETAWPVKVNGDGTLRANP